ncbi:hypothetical protein D3C76_1636330 [compost metagenome]
MLDAFGDTHVRPGAAAFVISLHGGVQCRQCRISIEQRGAAEDDLSLAVTFF